MTVYKVILSVRTFFFILPKDQYNLGSCFKLALWVPAFILVGAALVFFVGTCFYYNKPPSGNVIVKASGAIKTAIKEKRKVKKSDRDPDAHWLDYAIPR